MTRAPIAAILLAATAGRATADDSVGTADTVASTWSGGALQLGERDKRFVLALTTLVEGIRARAEISAPLDAATRIAAFVGKSGLAPAFRGTFHIGYDSTYHALALEPSDAELLPYCDQHKITPCTASKVAEDKLSTADARKRQGQPLGTTARYWAAGLDLSFAYDRTTAYVTYDRDGKPATFDVGNASTTTLGTMDLQIGGSATMYVPGGWVFSFRAGYERTKPLDIVDFRRCTILQSTDSTITGQTCTDEHYQRSDPGAQHSGYARLAGAYYPSTSILSSYLSATELRFNFENLATKGSSFDVNLLVFAKGYDVGGSGVRVGIGATVKTALLSPPNADYHQGNIYDYSLFGIAGTSF